MQKVSIFHTTLLLAFTVLFATLANAQSTQNTVTFYANISDTNSESGWVGHVWVGLKDGLNTSGDNDLGDGTYSRSGNKISYAWNYSNGGNKYQFSFSLKLGQDFDEMQNWYSTHRHPEGNYQQFVVGDQNFNVIEVISDELWRQSDCNGLRFEELALAFVQSLKYDDRNHSIQRYASETAIDGRGDCSDTSVLYAGLLRSKGIGHCFLSYPEHLAVGIWCSDNSPGTSYLWDGRKYFLAETTGTGTHIGYGLNKSQHGNGRAKLSGKF